MGQNGLPDPDIDRRLDEAFGTAEELAAATEKDQRLKREVSKLHTLLTEAREQIEVIGNIRRQPGGDPPPEGVPASVTQAGGWVAPSDFLSLPGVAIKRGGLQFPTWDGEPPTGKMIYTLLWRVMADVSHVAKNELFDAPGAKYSFRGIDAVVNALGPALRTHGVIAVPKLKKVKYRDTMTTSERPKPTREVTLRVKYTFYAPDGSKVTAVVPGESLDHSDKGSAKAMSVAFRIALLQIFALPTTEADPDASYHTRDGAGSMSPSVATFIKTRIGLGQPGVEQLADALELEQLWPIVLEHSAAERTVPFRDGSTATGDAAFTWTQAFMARFSVLIEGVETIEEGRSVTAVIDRMGFMRQLGMALRERGAFIKERTAKTYDHGMERILAARSVAELETAVGCVEAAEEERIITKEQSLELHLIAEERRPKLPPEVAPEPEEEAKTISGDPEMFMPTEGPAWEQFCAAADAPELNLPDLIELLTNENDRYDAPAASWGTAGLQRVADAAARSHRRDHTIDNVGRAEIEQAMREHAEMVGLNWTGGWAGE
jgi:hypothetical protein